MKPNQSTKHIDIVRIKFVKKKEASVIKAGPSSDRMTAILI